MFRYRYDDYSGVGGNMSYNQVTSYVTIKCVLRYRYDDVSGVGGNMSYNQVCVKIQIR